MRMTIIGIALSAMLFALCVPAQAQEPGKIPRIGHLFYSGFPASIPARIDAFRQGFIPNWAGIRPFPTLELSLTLPV
jgi:hypothetical protein